MLKSKSVSGSFGTGGEVFSWFPSCFYSLISLASTRQLITLIGQKYSRWLALLSRRQYWSINMFNIVYVVFHVNITYNS